MVSLSTFIFFPAESDHSYGVWLSSDRGRVVFAVKKKIYLYSYTSSAMQLLKTVQVRNRQMGLRIAINRDFFVASPDSTGFMVYNLRDGTQEQCFGLPPLEEDDDPPSAEMREAFNEKIKTEAAAFLKSMFGGGPVARPFGSGGFGGTLGAPSFGSGGFSLGGLVAPPSLSGSLGGNVGGTFHLRGPGAPPSGFGGRGAFERPSFGSGTFVLKDSVGHYSEEDSSDEDEDYGDPRPRPFGFQRRILGSFSVDRDRKPTRVFMSDHCVLVEEFRAQAFDLMQFW